MYKDHNKNNLIVEALQAKHIPMLAISNQSKRIGWIQSMLLKTWLSEAEGKLQGLIPSRQPRCLVALEGKDLIAIIVLQPNNRRGSCWSISLPEFLKEPNNLLKSNVTKLLLIKALKLENNFAPSWIIRCSSTDLKQLSILRELGFQPLKLIKSMKAKKTTNLTNSDEIFKNKINWESLTRNNAKLLYSLKRSSESVYLREILDIQCIDLLDRNQPENGILVSDSINQRTAILGLITPICAEDPLSLELIRDTAWDSRITNYLPNILNNLLKSHPQISIEISSEDNPITNNLKDLDWQEQDEIIILGRSPWKRKINNKFILKENTINSIFTSLKPNQPPLPTPLLENY